MLVVNIVVNLTLYHRLHALELLLSLCHVHVDHSCIHERSSQVELLCIRYQKIHLVYRNVTLICIYVSGKMGPLRNLHSFYL